MNPSLQNILEDCGYETDCYSGRGMGGKYCLSITVQFDSIEKVIAKSSMMFASQVDEKLSLDDPTIKEFIRVISSVKSDRMGRDNVYYWPSQQWVDPEPESESIPSEDDLTDDCD